MTEGKGYLVAVNELTRTGSTHNIILVPGLKIFITHIDPFLIDQVGLGIIGDIFAIVAAVGHGDSIFHGRSGVIIEAIGVCQRTGGIHLTRQNIRYRIGSVSTHAAGPKTCIDAVDVILHKIHLQSIGGIDEHDDFLELAVLFHFG